MQIRLKPGAILPSYQTEGAAGMDLHACLEELFVLRAGERSCIPTGVFLAIPPGVEGHIRPRSGWATKFGITTLSGTIDSDFRGELCANLINLGREDWVIMPGMRIAQIVFTPVLRMTLEETDVLDVTPRGTGGFGSTGS